jgi:hypothetical protein
MGHHGNSLNGHEDGKCPENTAMRASWLA